jgi:hypothetical protein
VFTDVDSRLRKKNKISGGAQAKSSTGALRIVVKGNAVGHAGATVHVETHALGLVIYELTAIVLKYGKEDYRKPVSEKIEYYYERLLYWQDHADLIRSEWADFMLDDSRPNKERLLNEKRIRTKL